MMFHLINIYISENGEVYCYSSVFYEKDYKLPNFLRIKQGCIIVDEFLNQKKYKDIKFKKLNQYLYLPFGNKRFFGVSESWNSPNTDEVTREIFGLTQLELDEVLEAYSRTFGLYKRDKMAYMLQTREKTIYPYQTSSNTKDNCCELTDLWIPSTFPYIKFADKKFSHVSLYGFYRHLASLILPRLYSDVSYEFKKFIRKETFDKFCKIDFKLCGYKRLEFDS